MTDDAGPPFLAFYDRLLALDRRGAARVAEDYLAGGGNVLGLYSEVFDPCLVHTGCEWEGGRISVAHEHFITEATRELIHRHGPAVWADPTAEAPVALACCVPGENHSIGLAMVCDVLRGAGLVVHTLGVGLPAETTVAFARQVGADLVCLSCALDIHLPDAIALVALFKRALPGTTVALGGAAVRGKEAEFVRGLGADLTAADVPTFRVALAAWLAARGASV